MLSIDGFVDYWPDYCSVSTSLFDDGSDHEAQVIECEFAFYYKMY